MKKKMVKQYPLGIPCPYYTLYMYDDLTLHHHTTPSYQLCPRGARRSSNNVERFLRLPESVQAETNHAVRVPVKEKEEGQKIIVKRGWEKGTERRVKVGVEM